MTLLKSIAAVFDNEMARMVIVQRANSMNDLTMALGPYVQNEVETWCANVLLNELPAQPSERTRQRAIARLSRSTAGQALQRRLVIRYATRYRAKNPSGDHGLALDLGL